MSLDANGTRTSTGPPQPAVETVVVGASVGHYHVLARLGAGAMGVVYEAEDLRLGRRVALKFLPESLASDPASLSRFEREARMASSLNHPHICTIHDIGTFGRSPYIVMELLEGETLRSRIAAGPLSVEDFLEGARQIVSAVAAAHARKIVHRDLKPANIFVTRSGVIKVLDFGLAKPVADPDVEMTAVVAEPEPEPDLGPQVDEPELVTIPGTVLGTTAYMSPEQITGRRVDARSDVFALGVIFYEALTGSRPFAGADIMEVRQQILRKDPVPLGQVSTGIPSRLDRLVLRCLEKHYDRRFPSAVELLSDLTALVKRTAPRKPAADEEGEGPKATPGWRSKRISNVAVLPFETRGTDPDSAYLGDGIAEDLIRDLSHVPGLRVKARSVVQRYRGQQPAPAAVGDDLGVDAVVLGTVAKRAQRLTVNVDFVRCEDESLLWGGRVTRGVDEIISIEDEVLGNVVQEITARLGGDEAPAPARRYAPSSEAHHLYLRGRACWNERTPESLKRAIEYFSLAVDTDPEYGLAFSGLADAYCALGFYDVVPPADVMPRAKAAARRAVERDPELPEGHASLGLVSSIWDFDWQESGRRLRKSLDLNASLAYVHHWYAMQLSTLGRGDEAYAEIKRALVLDPLSTAAQGDALNILIRSRRFEDGAKEARRVLLLEPKWPAGWAALGRAFQYGSRTQQALDAFEEAVGMAPTNVRMRALLAGAYGVAGREEDARRIQAALVAEADAQYVPSFWLAVVALCLGDSDGALTLLERATEERYPQVAYLAVEPGFDALRSEPRFVRLLERIGIAGVA